MNEYNKAIADGDLTQDEVNEILQSKRKKPKGFSKTAFFHDLCKRENGIKYRMVIGRESRGSAYRP